MIEQPVEFHLPKPWSGELFQRERWGVINFLVGPNGSGKSRFANELKTALPSARLLGTDRLQGTGINVLKDLLGDSLASGYQKERFSYFKQAGANYGSGLDTFIVLEERPDIRIHVEATLTALFNRRISIEWDSGNLIPKATVGSAGDAYRMDRDECHGIRELLVLLTHLYSDAYRYLIVDEPELNLHPQYQAFFMQEVRKIAGKPEAGSIRKGIVLITHSPFIIDLKSRDDLESVISFSSDHSVPVFVKDPGERLTSLIPRLNVHHKQLFFSDNPIFVEGILDAQIIEAIQERRKFSITSAGSCLIDVGGCEEVTKYVELCRHLKKSAFFFFDLDSLFIGTLRQCIRADGTIAEFLASLGLGSDFGRYCGELDRKLTEAINKVRDSTLSTPQVEELEMYFQSLTTDDGQLLNKDLAKARIALLIDLERRPSEITNVISSELASDIKGHLNQVLRLLSSKNVFILRGGALEHYLPTYSGNRYKLDEGAKRTAVNAEVAALSQGLYDDILAARYGGLYENICRLPAKPPVDTDSVLREYLSDYIHELQGTLIANADWGAAELNKHFERAGAGLNKLFQIESLTREENNRFAATVKVLGSDGRLVDVSHDTNAGMRQFTLRPTP